nr:IclR family transcriptional regulator C-terminal domain-containing protein [Phytoactinopolyspora alkaliphila]
MVRIIASAPGRRCAAPWTGSAPVDTLVDDEENAYGLRCVAVPLRLDDDVLGAASVSGATGELAPESEESLASTRR